MYSGQRACDDNAAKSSVSLDQSEANFQEPFVAVVSA